MLVLKVSSWLCVVATVVLISAQLLWQWWHGGIEAHHLLADPALPAISNAWGLLLLPLLGVLTARRMHAAAKPAAMWWPILLAFIYGAMLAALFVSGAEDLLPGAIVATFALALVLPLYRAEYLLGYIAGLSFAFGPVLPLLPATPAVLIAWLAMLAKQAWQQRRRSVASD